MSAGIERTQMNFYMDFLRKEIRKSAGHPAQAEFKKLLRGMRRRRNRYMRNGEWPPADLKGLVGKLYGFKAVNADE